MNTAKKYGIRCNSLFIVLYKDFVSIIWTINKAAAIYINMFTFTVKMIMNKNKANIIEVI